MLFFLVYYHNKLFVHKVHYTPILIQLNLNNYNQNSNKMIHKMIHKILLKIHLHKQSKCLLLISTLNNSYNKYSNILRIPFVLHIHPIHNALLTKTTTRYIHLININIIIVPILLKTDPTPLKPSILLVLL